MSLPDYALEQAAIDSGARFVAGVDEVGRGPLAGPVTAAAVILDMTCLPEGLNDSKKLTAKRRDALADAIMAGCDWAVAHATVAEIDELNILRASHLAMCRAISGLRQRPCMVLVDGNLLPRDLEQPGQAVVKGDARSLSIAAASILAKVARDRIMVDLAQQHPGYGWEGNAGYPTKAHRQALLDLGVTPHHRRSFAPIHNILCKGLLTSS
ncbi:ribonuclease HII [Paracoccus aestuariivivens]|uniref:Ribonuclease HII n=1 Tax=Paracoccus aestuariivivens TaxID=1820333 RepID=A0A6L6JFP1_9RHOB|nr:ribonuclease HII [Paracoccus aestuariivivens]MTH78924.1 ribonuclease HII [Paracoccus aestuariivivens]